LRSGTADAVHRHGRNRDRQAGLNRSLTGRIHLGPGLNDIPHRHGLDLFGLEPCALDGRTDRDGAEIGRRHILQGSAKGADRRAHWFRDHH
jgi:hypothetical protein